ncbi:MAG: hypothetical protein QG594_608, partial [Bacteroidota bacterium]|nr:hypothetical protein [Bacteroidota bacterium]
NAKDFESCEGEDCTSLCSSSVDLCEEIPCSSTDGDECVMSN